MAKKDINIVTSLVGKGLEREAILLKTLLGEHDVYCNPIHYCNWGGSALVRADVNMYLEVIHPLAFSLSREHWLFPNCEWWDARNDQFISKFTKICCKTRDCERIWRSRVANDRPERVVYTGFECRDLFDPSVPRENRFLHVAGQSEFKNTEAVIEAWKKGNWSNRPLPLTVITQQPRFRDMCEGIIGVTCVFGKIPDGELKQLMNSHRFHLMPSAYEGFGHALHEAVGCGALVLTSQAAPMSEVNGIVPEWTVNIRQRTPRALAVLNHATWIDVQVACNKATQACETRFNEFESRQATARSAFLSDREAFRRRLLGMVGV